MPQAGALSQHFRLCHGPCAMLRACLTWMSGDLPLFSRCDTSTRAGAGSRWTVEDRRAVDPAAARAPAGRHRTVFTAIVDVLTTGCAWRHLPPEFGVAKATAHRGSWPGPRPGWTRPACGRRKGPADRPEPGRRRQARLQAARPDRPERPAAGGG